LGETTKSRGTKKVVGKPPNPHRGYGPALNRWIIQSCEKCKIQFWIKSIFERTTASKPVWLR